MGRKAHFQHEEFLDAAVEIIAKDGLSSLTVAALAARVQAPVGSVYHRFSSLDALLAEVWLKIIESFQKNFIHLLRKDGLRATLYCLHWVRRHPNEARVMLLYRIHDFISGTWPPDLQKHALRLDNELHEAVAAFIRVKFGKVTPKNIERTIFAVYDAPIGIISRYLRHNKIPPASVNELIRETYRAVIEKAP